MERLFRSLKSEWIPATGYLTALEAQRDISHYLMHRYNWIRPHQFNDGLPPAVAEENLTHYPGWIDHYRPSKALANRDHSFPPKPAQANALLVPLLAALDVPGIRFVYSRPTLVAIQMARFCSHITIRKPKDKLRKRRRKRT